METKHYVIVACIVVGALAAGLLSAWQYIDGVKSDAKNKELQTKLGKLQNAVLEKQKKSEQLVRMQKPILFSIDCKISQEFVPNFISDGYTSNKTKDILKGFIHSFEYLLTVAVEEEYTANPKNRIAYYAASQEDFFFIESENYHNQNAIYVEDFEVNDGEMFYFRIEFKLIPQNNKGFLSFNNDDSPRFTMRLNYNRETPYTKMGMDKELVRNGLVKKFVRSLAIQSASIRNNGNLNLSLNLKETRSNEGMIRSWDVHEYTFLFEVRQ
ncbi:hypothetical protein B0O79_3907 [Flavobacteriaceae bacterium MAR_2009_75]|nr:hypothetical protein B0O79_3907 [Flavobacteriaceae bacterium MAR_2009_75]